MSKISGNDKYYRIFQSKEADNILSIPDFELTESNKVYGIVRQVEYDDSISILNYYEKPRPLVSTKTADIIKLFDRKFLLKPLAIANLEYKFEMLFWILNLESVDSISENGMLKIIQGERKLKDLFKITSGLKEYVVMHYDLLNELLKNQIFDIEYEEIEVIDKR